ncbi:MAG TPA: Hsp20/alpha crystallin family protein, partial [Terriglobia bacterium]|nr:Hsp20/alpha crystallin family protein [Terriglobia bacterium]
MGSSREKQRRDQRQYKKRQVSRRTGHQAGKFRLAAASETSSGPWWGKQGGFMRNFYEELFGFRREFEEMFNRMLTGRPWAEWAELPAFKREFNFTPAVEAYVDKEGKRYICRVTLPGVEPKDVQVQAQGNVLTIHGERKFTRKTKEVELMEQEFAYGVFDRTLTLPEGVIVEKLTAEFVNGVLEITAPIAIAALPRKIEIKTAAPT